MIGFVRRKYVQYEEYRPPENSVYFSRISTIQRDEQMQLKIVRILYRASIKRFVIDSVVAIYFKEEGQKRRDAYFLETRAILAVAVRA